MDVIQYEADLAYRRAILEGDDDIAVGGDAAETLSTTDQIANVLRAIGPAAGAIQQLASKKPVTQALPKPEEKKKDDKAPQPFYVAHPWLTLGAGVAGLSVFGFIVAKLVRR